MKILSFIVSIIIIIVFMEISLADDEVDLVAMKRPFCNAFTGCGKKRNQVGAPGIQIPIPIYRALLRLATTRSGTGMRQRLLQQELQLQNLQLPPPPPRASLI